MLPSHRERLSHVQQESGLDFIHSIHEQGYIPRPPSPPPLPNPFLVAPGTTTAESQNPSYKSIPQFQSNLVVPESVSGLPANTGNQSPGVNLGLDGIDSIFERHGLLQPGDMVDFYGASGCGKTLYLYAIIISTILPRSWRYSKSKPAVLLNGKARSVIFLDLEQGFCADQLKSLLYLEIMARLGLYEQSENAKSKGKEKDTEGTSETSDTGNKEDSNDERTGSDTSTANQQQNSGDDQGDFFIDTQSPEMKGKIEQLIVSCLRNVHVFRPQDAISAIVILRTLDHYMTSNSMSTSTSKQSPPFSILMIDSISSFYWQERTTNSHSRSITMLIDALNRLVPRWKLIFISTTWLLPSKTSATDRTITDNLRARFKYRFLMQPRTLEKFDSQGSLVQEWIRRQKIKIQQRQQQQQQQQQDSLTTNESRDEYPGSVFQAQMLIPSIEHSPPEFFRFSISDVAGVCSFSAPF